MVVGYIDDEKMIEGVVYCDNWDLSVVCVSCVVCYFISKGVNFD